MIKRIEKRRVKVADLFIGGNEPVSIQSMTCTPTSDPEATLKQIRRLEQAGCEIVRVGVPDMESARCLGKIVQGSKIPVVADIHFDVALAFESLRQGVAKLRINPGNLRNKDEVKDLAMACRKAGVPIRIGVNAGSISKEILEKYGTHSAPALVESAMNEVRLLESVDFRDIIISLKSSSVPVTVSAYRKISELCDYPLHIGITEAGTVRSGSVKSAVGLGILLADGIGDTVRVSLSGDPVEEVSTGWAILKALEIRKRGVEIISCPTCARTSVDVIGLAEKLEKELKNVSFPLRIAVMGCVVNGPGEAKTADLGVAGSGEKAVLFSRGEGIRSVSSDEILPALMEEIDRYVKSALELTGEP